MSDVSVSNEAKSQPVEDGMETRVDVFLTHTPFQLLNALEAEAVYGAVRSIFVVQVSKVAETRPQVAAVLAAFPEREVLWTEKETSPKQVAAKVRAEAGPNADIRVFAGTHRVPGQREIIRRLSRRPPVLFDDGTETLLMARRRARFLWRLTNGGGQYMGSLGRRWRYPFPEILRDIARPRQREFAGVEYFSIYRVSGTKRDTWTPNRLSLLAGRRKAATESAVPIFVGSSLVEHRMLDEQTYADLVGQAVRSTSVPLRYFAHRHELDDRLARLAETHPIEIVRPWGPIELVLVQEGIRPDPLHVVMSTVVDSLQLVYPAIEVVSHRPPLEAFDRYSRPQVAAMIEAHRDAAGAVAAAGSRDDSV